MSYSIFRGEEGEAPAASVVAKRPPFAEQKPETKFLRMSDLTFFPRKDQHCMRLDADGEVERLSPVIAATMSYYFLIFLIVLVALGMLAMMVGGIRNGDMSAVKMGLSALAGLVTYFYVARAHYKACSYNTYPVKAMIAALGTGAVVNGVASVLLR